MSLFIFCISISSWKPMLVDHDHRTWSYIGTRVRAAKFFRWSYVIRTYLSKIAVPRDVSRLKSPETRQVQERLVSTLNICKSHSWTEPGVGRSKRLLVACRTCHIKYKRTDAIDINNWGHQKFPILNSLICVGLLPLSFWLLCLH